MHAHRPLVLLGLSVALGCAPRPGPPPVPAPAPTASAVARPPAPACEGTPSCWTDAASERCAPWLAAARLTATANETWSNAQRESDPTRGVDGMKAALTQHRAAASAWEALVRDAAAPCDAYEALRRLAEARYTVAVLPTLAPASWRALAPDLSDADFESAIAAEAALRDSEISDRDPESAATAVVEVADRRRDFEYQRWIDTKGAGGVEERRSVPFDGEDPATRKVVALPIPAAVQSSIDARDAYLRRVPPSRDRTGRWIEYWRYAPNVLFLYGQFEAARARYELAYAAPREEWMVREAWERLVTISLLARDDGRTHELALAGLARWWSFDPSPLTRPGPFPVPYPPVPPDPIPPMPAPMATDPASKHVCTEIVGLDHVALSFDGGKTLVRARDERRGGEVPYGLVSLGTPYTLAALVFGQIFLSVDGGCHWSSRGRTTAREIAEGHHGVAYGWDWNGQIVAITTTGLRTLAAPCNRIAHIDIDPSSKRHLKLIATCGVYDSDDEGKSWRSTGEIGRSETGESWLSDQGGWGRSAVAYASHDMNHILLAAMPRANPLRVTRDGARTWTEARLVDGSDINDVFFSPDGRTAWSLGSGLERSADGGTTFKRVATPVPVRTDALKLVGGQSDPGVIVLRSHVHLRRDSVVRVDVRTGHSTEQALPLDIDQYIRLVGGGEEVVSATLVPGEPSALCVSVTRHGLADGRALDP